MNTARGRDLSSVIVAAVVAMLVATIVTILLTRSREAAGVSAAAESVTAYRRVLASGTIRAGYIAYPPASIVDPRTGAVSGVFPDLLMEIGKLTSLKVEFVREVGYADMIQGLESGKYDIVGGVWANPNRGKAATLSTPVYYTGVKVWVRPNENRFSADRQWASLNRPEVRIAAIDGSTPLNIARKQFPEATLKTYPNQTTESQLFLDLVQNKVDVFFAEPAQGARYLKSNPDSIRDISGDKPLRVFASVYLMGPNEGQLKTLIDTAIQEAVSSGEAERIIQQYEPTPGVFMMPAAAYRQSGGTGAGE